MSFCEGTYNELNWSIGLAAYNQTEPLELKMRPMRKCQITVVHLVAT